MRSKYFAAMSSSGRYVASTSRARMSSMMRDSAFAYSASTSSSEANTSSALSRSDSLKLSSASFTM